MLGIARFYPFRRTGSCFLLQPETEVHDLHIETLVHERMALIAPPGDPLVPCGYVEPAHLKDETILHTEPGCTYRALFEQRLATQVSFHKKKWLSPALREFLLLVEQHAAEWRQNYVR